MSPRETYTVGQVSSWRGFRLDVKLTTFASVTPEVRKTILLTFFKALERKTLYSLEQIDICHLERPFQLRSHLHVRTSHPDAIDLGEDHDRKIWGYRLRILRQKLGWSQKTLSQMTQINRGHISDLERGKHLPHPGVWDRLYGVMKMHEKELVELSKQGAQMAPNGPNRGETRHTSDNCTGGPKGLGPNETRHTSDNGTG
ncbi:MAG: helix-turn-helix transcriptional regulator [Bdellovibrionales bacterium]|nr:helix-turn-helix transcriptional regulator [Bdellovibrionales bacterium]